MAKELKERHHIFVREYLKHGGHGAGAEAVRKAGFNTKYPDKRAYELLRNPLIQALIDDYMQQVHKQQKHVLINAFDIGFKALREVAQSEKAGIAKVEAAKELIHLAGHVPEQNINNKINANVNSNLTINDTDTAREKLAGALARFVADTDESADPASGQ